MLHLTSVHAKSRAKGGWDSASLALASSPARSRAASDELRAGIGGDTNSGLCSRLRGGAILRGIGVGRTRVERGRSGSIIACNGEPEDSCLERSMSLDNDGRVYEEDEYPSEKWPSCDWEEADEES